MDEQTTRQPAPKWHIEKRNVATLKEYEGNPRRITEKEFAKLQESMKRFGLAEPIVIQPSGHIIGGHARLKALKIEGATECDCYVPDRELSEDEHRELLLRLNRNIAGEWNWDDLANWNMDFLLDAGFELEEFGMEKETDNQDAEPQVDKAEELNKIWQVKTGDLWQIGSHRLLCGDSTKAEDVKKVMGGEQGGAVITDPPYGVAVVKSGMVGADFGIAKKGKYAPVEGDDKTPDVRHLLSLAKKQIIWGGNYFADQLPAVGSWLVWDKRSDSGIENTFADCELAWSNIGCPARIYRQLWNGMIREGEHDKRVHPTQKPVRLLQWCVEKTEGAIIDPYLGSGTTMVSAENLKRRCFGIEISPDYCAVILQRMKDAFPNLEITKTA